MMLKGKKKMHSKINPVYRSRCTGYANFYTNHVTKQVLQLYDKATIANKEITIPYNEMFTSYKELIHHTMTQTT